jgi:hypothetical protein
MRISNAALSSREGWIDSLPAVRKRGWFAGAENAEFGSSSVPGSKLFEIRPRPVLGQCREWETLPPLREDTDPIPSSLRYKPGTAPV